MGHHTAFALPEFHFHSDSTKYNVWYIVITDIIPDKLTGAWRRVKEDWNQVKSGFFEQPIPIQASVVTLLLVALGVGIPTFGLALPISLPLAIVIGANIMHD